MGERKSRAVSLVAVNTRAGDLKSIVGALEGDVAMLKSETATLENVVAGETFEQLARPALLQKSSAPASASSLKSRINALEDEIDITRSRMTNLEHTVVG